jgi:hypothetical protein
MDEKIYLNTQTLLPVVAQTIRNRDVFIRFLKTMAFVRKPCWIGTLQVE